MNKLNLAVSRAAHRVWRVVLFFINPLLRLLGFVFGHWQAPAWAAPLAQRLAPLGNFLLENGALVVLALLLALGAWATPRLMKYNWQRALGQYKSVQPDQPQALASGISVLDPARTALEDGGKPNPAVLNFSASAAPLAWIGKEAQDVHMSPNLPGKWVWAAPNRLQFTPADEWPIDVQYSVTLGPKALAAHVAVEREVGFHSPRFEMKMRDATFYQDPVQFTLRKAVFEIGFSHPVDPELLEKKLKLVAESDTKGLFAKPGDDSKLTVTWDKFKLLATVHSEALRIPPQTASLALVVGSGVQAARGGNKTADEQKRALSIPGLYSLDIAELKQAIVTGDSGEPENVLQMTTGMAVNEKEIKRAVQAWLLPATHKVEGADSSDWTDPADITDEVLKKAAAIKLELSPGERENTENHVFKFAAEPARFMFVRVQKGLKSSGGYQLGATREEIFRIKRSAPELAIMSKGSLLAMSGEKKLPLLVRDLPGVHVEIGRLLPQQLQHLVTQSSGDMSKPEFYRNLTPDSLTERFEKNLELNLKPGKTHYEAIDFSQYLKSDAGDRRGIFILTVQGYDPHPKKGAARSDFGDQSPTRNGYYNGEGEYYGGEGEGEADSAAALEQQEAINWEKMRDRRLVIVTDLGMIAKAGIDGSRDVFVQSIHDGNAVAAATVEVWARNGAVLLSQNTDANGTTHLPDLSSFVREKTPAVLVVKKGGDLAFLPLNRQDRVLDLSRFDVGGVHVTSMPNQMQAYLFSDRGMYRPGDTINVGIAVKSVGWAQKLADLPVEAEVIDARGLVVRRQKLKLGAGGMVEFSHATQESSPTGNFTINLNLARDTGSTQPGTQETPALQLGTLTVKVQEFMPDRSKVTARLSTEVEQGWISPKDLSAKVNVQNLFGTPAQQRRVEALLTLKPSTPAFRSFPDYFFSDPANAKEKIQDELPKTVTDSDGNATLALGVQRYKSATYQLHLLVKAFEPEGGRSVAAETQALVSERAFLVGYKPDGDLAYVTKNGVRNVNLIAIDNKARATLASKLRLQRIERKVLSVLVKQGNGLLKYESRTTERVLNEENFNIAASGSKLPLATQTPGNFAYVLRDGEGQELARIDYGVAGSGNVSRSLDRNAELQMALNKKDYNPGDEIEISIRAPYTGVGLITIERDRVYTHRWFRATENASVQKISLPKDFEGNGYVSVQFARDLASNEIYMSPLSYGVVPFATSLARRSNPLTLTAPDKVKPGQPVKIRLEAKHAARAVVFAVDEGILQVARYQTPDPIKFFFQKKALEVTTLQTLDLVLPEFKKLMSAAAPGGDGEGQLGKHLNPFKRKTDKPVVFWSGLLDIKGSQEVSYTPPENFNGSLRIMAVVINDDTAAAAQTATTVRGDLVLLPNVPVAMTPGDEVEIGVGVANNMLGSGKNAPVTLGLTVSKGLEVVGAPQQVLKISERGEASTKFLVRARAGEAAQLGSASVVFTAQLKDAKARLSTDTSVRPASANVTLVQTGTFRGNGEIVSQANMYPQFKRSEVSLSTSPWAFTSGLIQYLEVYPHGCSEQITSQTFPAILIGTQPELAKELLKHGDANAPGKLPDPRKTFERYLAQARARQTAEGGFSMWPGNHADLFATAYISHLLIEAKERKLPVPNDMLQKANAYMQSQIGQSTNDRWLWRTQAYAAYLLTRQGIMTTAALSNLREAHRQAVNNFADSNKTWQAEQKERMQRDLGTVYLAASFQMMKQDAIAEEMLAPSLAMLARQDDYHRYWYWDYYYDPLVQSASTVGLVARHFPKHLKEVPKSYWDYLANVLRDGYYQSHSAAMVMLAVDGMSTAAQQAAAGKVGVSAVDAAGLARAMEVPKQFVIASMDLPPMSAKVKLANGSDVPLFYSWAESGYEKALPKEAKSEGMEIIHEFLNARGEVVNEAALGEEVTVRVRVRSIDRYQLPQVALVDVLPGGLEPVLTSPSDSDDPEVPLWRKRLGGKSTWNIEYADIREDRVIFYGGIEKHLTEVTYKVRATNVGTFVVPAAYGEAMYEHRIYARSAGGSFRVVAAK
jgi:uncharacterized protein YfaS (alpha-2-macroglobulin family)